MDPAEERLRENPTGFHAAPDACVSAHLQSMGEALVSLSNRATMLEAALDQEASGRIGLARRSAELGLRLDHALKTLEQPRPPPLDVAPTVTSTPSAYPTPRRSARWTFGMAMTLLLVLAAFWASRQPAADGPSPRTPSAPTGSVDARRKVRAPSPGPTAVPDSPPASRNSPVFELYSPAAPPPPAR
jgi:hypothetical protein